MANRSMEAKVLKIKRMRRAWNRYGNIKSGAVPSRVVLDQYRMSAKGLDGSSDILAEKIALGFRGITPERLESIKRQAQLEAALPDGLSLSVNGPGPCNRYQECKTYFNSKKDQYVIVFHDIQMGVVKRSIVYGNFNVLAIRWEQSKVVWISTAPIPKK